ncbi:MAG: toxic anion resistance protein [Solobacterium sp.]|nr:toxic anion resistance protein [Solobacterium sp.]MBR2829052.1 toxic anion resistance protein [Solobacterium sp.]
MSENNNTQAQSIELVLSPEEVEKQQQAALADMEAEQAKIAEQTVKDQYDDKSLSEAERKTVNDFSEKIDIMESNVILQYGSAAQKKVTDFSDNALKNVRTKDLGEIGGLLSNLVTELKGFNANEEEKKGIFGLFKKGTDKAAAFKARYDKAEANVDKIAALLEEHQITLLKDIALLDQLYERNAQNTKELTMYIIAGRKKLAQVRNEEVPKLIEKARQSGLPEDTQAANDLAQACDRFEKKLYDLELTRQVSIQMAPQIRLIQNNDTLMTEKIQSTLVNTIPLWKNQIVLALGINHSKEAMEAEREVSNMTNELLKKNAETLHQATVEVAKESERGIVDIETLQHTNEELIATLDEVLAIQQEGHEKRQAAEAELARIESELHTKMLEINVKNDITRK